MRGVLLIVALLASCFSSAYASDGHQNFWEWLAPQLKLSEIQHPEIDYWEARYRRRHTELEVILRQGGDYLYPLAVSIRDRGMPLELVLLPIIESHLDPSAVSSGGARGLWQLLPATAAHLGLQRNWWFDESADFVRSTDVALNYLAYLHDRFGGWLLTLAAYNAGEGRVWGLMKQQRSKRLPADFWDLELPPQTLAYVPKLLGLARVLRNPGDIKLPPVYTRRSFVKLNTLGPLDVVQIADMAGISIGNVYRHNPQLLRWTTPPEGPHSVYLPIEHSQTFRTALATMTSKRVRRWSRYSVRSGDTLDAVAQRYGSSVEVLKDLNRLNSNTLQPGQSLVVLSTQDTLTPQTIMAAQHRGRVSHFPKPVAAGYHKVESGDSLWSIANQYGTSVTSLRQRNQLKPRTALVPGQLLHIGETQTSQRVFYKVRDGDVLSRIAQRYEVSVNEILDWNDLTGSNLQVGQTLELRVRNQ